MRDEDGTPRFRDPRTTKRIHPNEVYDGKEVYEEREAGDEPFLAMGRRSFDVRREVRMDRKLGSARCVVTNRFCVFS